MHVSSLPSEYGIGTLGKESYKFVDFLKKSGQRYWQMLPIGPTDSENSPYHSVCSYAGNINFIDLDLLNSKNLIKKEEYKTLDWGKDFKKVNYNKVNRNKIIILEKIYNKIKKEENLKFEEFDKKNKFWLEDYSLYMSLSEKFSENDWNKWKDKDIVFRNEESLKIYKNKLKDRINFWKYTQYWFFEQFENLKKYANNRNVYLIGDIPVYVPFDSVDVWVNPEYFLLKENLEAEFVAGCPPDCFSETGQLWGNPVYNWKNLRKDNYNWWIKRIEYINNLFNITRIDHFRAFESFYKIDSCEKNAINGTWAEGPGKEFFDVLNKRLCNLNLIAEDLGSNLGKGVQELLNYTGYPGMKVLQFAFDSDENNPHLLHLHKENNIIYTGTHDNNTVMGWIKEIKLKDLEKLKNFYNFNKAEKYNWCMIRLAYSSIGNIVIVPMQDFLGLNSEARMNIPGKAKGNWVWRAEKDYINNNLIEKIYNLTRIHGRLERKVLMNSKKVIKKLEILAQVNYFKSLNELNKKELYNVISKFILYKINNNWSLSKESHEKSKRAFYFSAEYLTGNLFFNNLFNLNILEEITKILKKENINIEILKEIDDPALGNGGLGRLAACFLDSAATHSVFLDGYGIRYKYGLFKQVIKNGFQEEEADNWQEFGDPWSVRNEEDSCIVEFSDQKVRAMPYDMPVIGYNSENINTLRLWQSESLTEFDFQEFNSGNYLEAVKNKNLDESISYVLYPNDNTQEGKILRLKQQYFFCSASLQDILKKFKKNYKDFSEFSNFCAIQLNDTHPVVSIPELIRLLLKEKLSFEESFEIAKKIFNYTNHTVMTEALETWDINLFKNILPEITEIIFKINKKLIKELKNKKVNLKDIIIDEEKIHMARLAVYVCKITNGVAKIHTEILKKDVLKNWYKIYPEKFQNKTNGITQRRWLGLCNPELSNLIAEYIGKNWLKNLNKLKHLEKYLDKNLINNFNNIKNIKKQELCEYIFKHENIKLDPEFIFDVQVKRLHEYKRQLLNAFSILNIYFKLKNKEIQNFYPTVYIFGAKAAPGYKRAKIIIKYINCVADLINNDPEVKDKIKIIFLKNYNCSYAEKIIPAADISEQISTAGTEASGTGNMKFMLNGAVTLGTYDGANIEIIEQAGLENNYIFGIKIEEINKIKNIYNPKEIYNNNPEIKRILDTLIDGTFDDGSNKNPHQEGTFAELYNSLLNGTSWHKPDNYFILQDLPDYINKKLQVNKDYQDRISFGKKCLYNIINSGVFSSDRTILEYSKEIWEL